MSRRRLCEVVNAPDKFVSTAPYKSLEECCYGIHGPAEVAKKAVQATTKQQSVVYKPLDSKFPVRLGGKDIAILDSEARFSIPLYDYDEEPFSLSDQEILKAPSASQVLDVEDDYALEDARKKKSNAIDKQRDSYVPFATKVIKDLRVLPPPTSAPTSAKMYLAREVKSIMKVQAKSSPQELGFYFDPSTTGDNLFHWVLELINFDPDLPLAKDLKDKNVKGIIFEVMFGSESPNAPPFFRVIHPRFLLFADGGGGHVTAGGSICMDLLTSSGWLPSYTVESILMQIRLAMSSLELKPARLHPTAWNRAYTVQEAIDGYKRAANVHGWVVPKNLDAVARGTGY